MRQTTVDTFDTYLAATTKTLTNKTIDVDNNTVSNIEVDNLKSGVLDTDLSSVAGTDTTLASAKAIKAYVDAQITAQDLDFQGDSGGALSIDLDSETLDIAGGTGIDTSGSSNTLTVAIDSTVATLAGTQTLTNKTLTTPVISSISNTGTITLPTSSDTLVGRATTDTLTNKTIDANGTGNSITNLEVADLASGVLDTDLSSVSGSDDTLASAKAIKTYIDAQVTAQDLDFQGDSGGALSIDLDSETLDIAGGTGIDTSGSSNTLTVAIDSTVTTLTGTQTLTNKTLTSPTINGGSLSSAVTATTQAAGTSNTTIATTAFAQTAASNEAVALAIALG
jgi:phosphopantetheinyl transferase (holo-ACP synthase)